MVTRKWFNKTFGTKISVPEWADNSTCVCVEYKSKNSFEKVLGESYDTLRKEGTAKYCRSTKTYVYFAKGNYKPNGEIIVRWE